MEEYPAESTAHWVLTPPARSVGGASSRSTFDQTFDLVAIIAVMLMFFGLVIALGGRGKRGGGHGHTTRRFRAARPASPPRHASWST